MPGPVRRMGSLLMLLSASASLLSPAAVPRLGNVLDDLEHALDRSRGIKCPFFRRRAGDALEAAVAVAQFVGARHKSLEVPLMPPASASGAKTPGLALSAVQELVAADISEHRYYVTGRLSSAIYSDGCIFDSPDPDMPVRSLRRFADALHGLFDPALSTVELISIECESRDIVARWRLQGALKLPWRPTIKPFTGCTRYEMDEHGLIGYHTEAWSTTALDAFISTFLPALGPPPAPPAAELRAALRVPLRGDRADELGSWIVDPPPRRSARPRAAGDASASRAAVAAPGSAV